MARSPGSNGHRTHAQALVKAITPNTLGPQVHKPLHALLIFGGYQVGTTTCIPIPPKFCSTDPTLTSEPFSSHASGTRVPLPVVR